MTTTRRSVDTAARAVLAARTEAILRASGAVLEPHVRTEDGRHTVLAVDGLRVLLDPLAAGELCGFWARLHRDAAGTATVDAVAGLPGPGLVLAFETARQLGVRAAHVSRGATGPVGVAQGGRVLLVADILERQRLGEAVAALEGVGGEVVGCATLVADPSERPVLVSPASGRRYELMAWWLLELGPREPGPATCPGCAAGRPLDGPTPGAGGSAGP
jgi:orotate phosphoribosyltransferase